ncbi:DHA2 family efflux MFS transporter permease subunit [Agromyces marinus]|uniref:MFS transporter n=1 Tax=Agromyces marinus TaxID=1389020 RepID=A0ABM8H3K1_9MICO|nr:DHA2 family efflux MFS transporter permease subunit [Agromyces marinus]UIP59578.1 Putative multidrug resistance protein MdtD [Agromyces marinus]BDZ55363.1 MFS transporter [Agromyces marinus]
MSTSKLRWLGLAVIGLAVSLIIVDTTIVNVAIPSIVDDLGLGSTQVQWVQESYTLVFAALLIPFGALGDRIGRRRILILGVTVFTAASVLAGIAPSGELLIAARVLQGVGGAMVLPGTLSLINAMFRGRDRTTAFAVWGSIIGGMAAVGPLLGGWLITDFSWRWAFGINVPFGILVVVGALLTLDESRSERPPARFDLLGALLVVIASGTLVFALIEGRTLGWWAAADVPAVAGWSWPFEVSPTPWLLVAAAVSGVAFIAWERRRRRHGRSTLLPLELFSIRTFSVGNLVSAIISLGELGILFVLPLWVQNVLGYDALQAGLLLISLAVGSFLATGAVSGLARKLSPVGILRLGIALELAGVLGLAITLSTDSSWVQLSALLFAYGLGIGLASSQVTNVVLADIPVDQGGQASGTQSTARQIGSALGIAILGTVLFGTLQADLDGRLDGLDASARDQAVTVVTQSAGAAIPALRADPATAAVGDQAAESFTVAASASAYGAAAFLALALAASTSLRSRSRSGGRGASGAGDADGTGVAGTAAAAPRPPAVDAVPDGPSA